MSESELVRLLLNEAQDTRGQPWMAAVAAVVLLVLFLDLWFPEWSYYLTIRRWTNGDPEPSDRYYLCRSIDHMATGVAFLVILGIGLWGGA